MTADDDVREGFRALLEMCERKYEEVERLKREVANMSATSGDSKDGSRKFCTCPYFGEGDPSCVIHNTPEKIQQRLECLAMRCQCGGRM
jgi:hypothetical protein